MSTAAYEILSQFEKLTTQELYTLYLVGGPYSTEGNYYVHYPWLWELLQRMQRDFGVSINTVIWSGTDFRDGRLVLQPQYEAKLKEEVSDGLRQAEHRRTS